MKKQINLICSILALLCVVSTLVPVIAPRFPAGNYYAPDGNEDYFYTGDYYLAKKYWSITDFAFTQSMVWRILLSFDQALLMLWAFISVRGESKKTGLAIAGFNLLLVCILVIMMMRTMWSCRWGVFVMLALDAIAAVVMATQAD